MNDIKTIYDFFGERWRLEKLNKQSYLFLWWDDEGWIDGSIVAQDATEMACEIKKWIDQYSFKKKKKSVKG